MHIYDKYFSMSILWIVLKYPKGYTRAALNVNADTERSLQNTANQTNEVHSVI